LQVFCSNTKLSVCSAFRILDKWRNDSAKVMNVRSLYKGFLFFTLSLDSLYIKWKTLEMDHQILIHIVTNSIAIVC